MRYVDVDERVGFFAVGGGGLGLQAGNNDLEMRDDRWAAVDSPSQLRVSLSAANRRERRQIAGERVDEGANKRLLERLLVRELFLVVEVRSKRQRDARLSVDYWKEGERGERQAAEQQR